ncbi:site-specific DNA-methyltransferase, partial [Candidatus Poribacteria bacterium]|nr:site-specific DNA-methyltransferase [Candidatus Poribacteria bacterium]
DIEFKNERYVLNWAGKSEAFKILQSPTTATLVPCKDESINFDKTENVFIEGENLEVLKVLQKSYFGKIKMIYIDPPYNTGNDNFIYPDKFSETKEEYLSRIGDKDEAGYMTREGLFRKNSKDSGHYHSNWLSMMYPRLFLARNLLREDGVIFVSIDENELFNLKLLMDEIYGSENFMTNFAIKLRHEERILKGDKAFHEVVEYVLLYQKSQERTQKKIMKDNTSLEAYRFKIIEKTKKPESVMFGDKRVFIFKPDDYEIVEGEHGEEKLKKISVRGTLKEGNSSGRFYMKHLNSIKNCYGYLYKVPDMGNDRYDFRYFLRPISEKNQNGDYFQGVPLDKKDFKEVPYPNFYNFVNEFNNVGYEGDIEFRNGKKPIKFLEKLIEIAGINKDDIILDFFSGSGSLAHAVLDLNKEDGGNRKFICVQLPEKCDEDSEAFKAGYKTIADVGKERIRRVIKKISAGVQNFEPVLDFDDNTAKQNLGFKVFKLQESNFKIWRPKIENEEQLVEQLTLHTDPVDKNAETDNILYELLLKSGVSLTAKIEEKKGYYWVNDGEIALILVKVNENIIKNVISNKPHKIITLDRLFKNNDQLKTNTALQMKDAGIEFKVI